MNLQANATSLEGGVEDPEKTGHDSPVTMRELENVTVFASDVVNFTRVSSTRSPKEIIKFMHDLFDIFDKVITCMYRLFHPSSFFSFASLSWTGRRQVQSQPH